jgi:quercetin dioxygenase-like cupin family protein
MNADKRGLKATVLSAFIRVNQRPNGFSRVEYYHPKRKATMEKPKESLTDASHLYEVERRARHAERPGFWITELQISPTQTVPWHCHSNIQDTFYVLAGRLRLFLREPKEEVRLGPGETYSVRPRRPHLVTNGGDSSATFLVLQGIGEYDYVPLV